MGLLIIDLLAAVNGVWYSEGRFAIRAARSCCLKPLELS